MKMQSSEPLSRNEKRLIVLHELSEVGRKTVKFEDLAVGLWKRFPSDFHLKGYPEFPDSDLHRPLYNFRMQGLLEVKEKVFSLTDKGIAEAEKAIKKSKGVTPEALTHKLDRGDEKEIKRLQTTNAFHLFLDGHCEDIVDTDFYTFLGTTVRSSWSEFRGRMRTVEDAIASASSMDVDVRTKTIAASLNELHKFLMMKFKGDIDYKRNNP